MKRPVLVCVSTGVVLSFVSQAFAWGSVQGPYGGAAYRGPMGGAAVRAPNGAAAVRGPAGATAYRPPTGGTDIALHPEAPTMAAHVPITQVPRLRPVRSLALLPRRPIGRPLITLLLSWLPHLPWWLSVPRADIILMGLAEGVSSPASGPDGRKRRLPRS